MQTIANLQQISYQKLTVLQMFEKKAKKSTGVARSKFLDRIKNSPSFESVHKQNLNVNDIRESSYKLPRSKSNTRNDHSLQRKSPIIINKGVKSISSFKNTSQIAFKEYASEMATFNNTVKLSNNYHFSQGNSDKFSYLHDQKETEYKSLNQQQLRQEEYALNYIKNLWENSAKLKQKNCFRPQMTRIQNILKEIIILIAKPKFNSIHDNSNFQLKAPSVKFSPFQNLNSYKQSKNISNQNSINGFQTNQQKNQENGNGNHESDHQEDIEFKKIMYILEEKSRIAKISPSDGKKEKRQLRELGELLNRRPLSYQSSFNCSSRGLSAHTIAQFEKANSSCSNDRVFLKNIVKKVKNTTSSYQEIDQLNVDKKSKSDLSSICQPESQLSNQVISYEQSEQKQILENQFMSDTINQSQQQEDEQQNQFQKYQYKQSDRADHIKIETLQTLQDQSESKRAVLNQIISMLNKKYHKNIRLEPPKH